MCNCSKKILQDGSLGDAYKTVIAVGTQHKKLILICEDCYNFFQKTLESEVFFDETKKCLIIKLL